MVHKQLRFREGPAVPRGFEYTINSTSVLEADGTPRSVRQLSHFAARPELLAGGTGGTTVEHDGFEFLPREPKVVEWKLTGSRPLRAARRRRLAAADDYKAAPLLHPHASPSVHQMQRDRHEREHPRGAAPAAADAAPSPTCAEEAEAVAGCLREEVRAPAALGAARTECLVATQQLAVRCAASVRRFVVGELASPRCAGAAAARCGLLVNALTLVVEGGVAGLGGDLDAADDAAAAGDADGDGAPHATLGGQEALGRFWSAERLAHLPQEAYLAVIGTRHPRPAPPRRPRRRRPSRPGGGGGALPLAARQQQLLVAAAAANRAHAEPVHAASAERAGALANISAAVVAAVEAAAAVDGTWEERHAAAADEAAAEWRDRFTPHLREGWVAHHAQLHHEQLKLEMEAGRYAHHEAHALEMLRRHVLRRRGHDAAAERAHGRAYGSALRAAGNLGGAAAGKAAPRLRKAAAACLAHRDEDVAEAAAGALRFHASPAAERALLHAAAGGAAGATPGSEAGPHAVGAAASAGASYAAGGAAAARRAALKTLLTKEGPIEQPTLSEAVRLLVRVPLRGKARARPSAPPAATPTATAPTATTRARTSAPTRASTPRCSARSSAAHSTTRPSTAATPPSRPRWRATRTAPTRAAACPARRGDGGGGARGQQLGGR